MTNPLLLESWEVRVPLMAAGYHRDLVAKVDTLRQKATIYPAPERVFYALRVTPFEAVRVVIVGQDPYHGPGQAHGLCFSVRKGVAVPPSLRNIFKEIERDLGTPPPMFPVPGGSLVHWAEQGALLLNTVLTVEEAQPGSHAKRGWEGLTDALIAHVAAQAQPVVFMLWGAHAQSKRTLISGPQHLVLCANHPSPLSALRPPVPFIGCGHFGQARAFRLIHGG